MFYSIGRFLQSDYAKRISPREREELRMMTKVFPFKVSKYVLDELIDWENIEEDPIYRLVFPRREMLSDQHWHRLNECRNLVEQRSVVEDIRRNLNPHPAGQIDNIPRIGDRLLGGLQHKYRETVLFFPAQGQTCHAYCTYCFRWAQFVNLAEHKFRSKETRDLYDYLKLHKEVTDILFTGGDPMWISNEKLGEFFDTLLLPELSHVRNIRIGTKSLAYHPERFLGKEGDVLMRLLAGLIKAGKSVAIMAHFSHDRELETVKVRKAVQRLRAVGVVIRTQAPLIKGINDDPETWKRMWNKQVAMGMVPYYMFVERDTGAQQYFAVTLNDAFRIFTKAYQQVSGLAKTVRGPSMSAWPGKVLISGIVGEGSERRFLLKFIQARDAQLVNRPFSARFDPKAVWFDDLEIEPWMQEELERLESRFHHTQKQMSGVA